MTPVSVVAASATATHTIHVSVYRISLRRSAISPMDPAGKAKRKNGSVEAVCVSATYSGPAPSDTISHADPTPCMKVPISEAMSAMSKCRKIGVRRGRHKLTASCVGVADICGDAATERSSRVPPGDGCMIPAPPDFMTAVQGSP